MKLFDRWGVAQGLVD